MKDDLKMLKILTIKKSGSNGTKEIYYSNEERKRKCCYQFAFRKHEKWNTATE